MSVPVPMQSGCVCRGRNPLDVSNRRPSTVIGKGSFCLIDQKLPSVIACQPRIMRSRDTTRSAPGPTYGFRPGFHSLVSSILRSSGNG